MATNRLGLALIGIACVVAAGAGSYIATRQNLGQMAVPAAVAASGTPATPIAEATATPPAAVNPAVPASPPEVSSVSPARRRTASPAVPPQPRRTPAATAPQTNAQAAGRPAAGRAVPESTAETVLQPPSSPLSAAVQPPVIESSAPSTDLAAVSTPVEVRPAEVTAPPVEPAPSRAAHEVIVGADSVIGLQIEGLITSDRARVEDRVEARVVRDVRVNGLVAIPAGTRALGTVVVVERGGKVRERARLGIKFDTLVLTDGSRLAIATEPIYRLGDSPSNGSRARIGGGAVAGAILGAIIAGGKGAAIGATTGAGAGTASVLAGERNAAIFPPGSEVTARILAPIAVAVERNDE